MQFFMESYLSSENMNISKISLIVPNVSFAILVVAWVLVVSTETLIFCLKKKKKVSTLNSRKKSILSFRLLSLTYIVCLSIYILTYFLLAWDVDKDSIVTYSIGKILTFNGLFYVQLASNKDAHDFLSRKLYLPLICRKKLVEPRWREHQVNIEVVTGSRFSPGAHRNGINLIDVVV